MSSFLQDLRRRALIAHANVQKASPRPAEEAMVEHLRFARLLFDFEAAEELAELVPDERERTLRVHLVDPALLGHADSELGTPRMVDELHESLSEWTAAAFNELDRGRVGGTRIRDVRIDDVVEAHWPTHETHRRNAMEVRASWNARLRSMGVEPSSWLQQQVNGLEYERKILSVGKSLTDTEVRQALAANGIASTPEAEEYAVCRLAVQVAEDNGMLYVDAADPFGHVLLTRLATAESGLTSGRFDDRPSTNDHHGNLDL
jgi:hypothetical protein